MKTEGDEKELNQCEGKFLTIPFGQRKNNLWPSTIIDMPFSSSIYSDKNDSNLTKIWKKFDRYQ